jgi:hypothetical protein
VKKINFLTGLFLTFSFLMSTSASALVAYDPNGIYMIGASVNAQLYNDVEYTPGIKDFIETAGDEGIFWNQIPTNYDLYYIKPLPDDESNPTAMVAGYKRDVTESFSPIVPGYVLVGMVGTMCLSDTDEDYETEGLPMIKSEVYDLILDANSSTTVVLMKYPTTGVSCGSSYAANAENYNGYLEYLKLWFASVRIIDPWTDYTTVDGVHADESTLIDAATRIKECFEDGLPLSCEDAP